MFSQSRYSDLYFSSAEYEQAVVDLNNCKIFDDVLAHRDATVEGGHGMDGQTGGMQVQAGQA